MDRRERPSPTQPKYSPGRAKNRPTKHYKSAPECRGAHNRPTSQPTNQMPTTVGAKWKQRITVMDGSIIPGKTQPKPDDYANALAQAKAFRRQKVPVPPRIQKIIDAHDVKVATANAASEAAAALRREAETLSRKAEIVKSKNADWLKGTFGEGVALLSPGAIVSIDAERFNRDLAAAASGSTRAHLV